MRAPSARRASAASGTLVCDPAPAVRYAVLPGEPVELPVGGVEPVEPVLPLLLGLAELPVVVPVEPKLLEVEPPLKPP
jgi:hypothetical protein